MHTPGSKNPHPPWPFPGKWLCSRRHRDSQGRQALKYHLHDVVEDTGVQLSTVKEIFGSDVAALVFWLTDQAKLEDGNRAHRKRHERDRLAKAPARAQTIKVADLIDNSRSILDRDPHFAKVYVPEKAALLDVLTLADPGLVAQARRQIDGHLRSLAA